MIDAPIETWYTWLGIAAVSVLALGTAVGIPSGPTPDANGVADTIDRVAADEFPATAEHGIAADRIRLSPTRVSLRGPGGSTTAPIRFGPITPATNAESDDRLRRVLHGEPPQRVFDSPDALDRAATVSRGRYDRNPRWERAPNRLRVRSIHWEGLRVTLVG
ncbi:hypothetical protein [Halopenitus sp. POP-27]|uniref:DUF7283 family protein n=1 Tax=Halopenitus sp. POP-27 TaxID=2994425 RepID=UPI0024688553|nr:hypothetical protein [Halopenitus sp. POP-27]